MWTLLLRILIKKSAVLWSLIFTSSSFRLPTVKPKHSNLPSLVLILALTCSQNLCTAGLSSIGIPSSSILFQSLSLDTVWKAFLKSTEQQKASSRWVSQFWMKLLRVMQWSIVECLGLKPDCPFVHFPYFLSNCWFCILSCLQKVFQEDGWPW